MRGTAIRLRIDAEFDGMRLDAAVAWLCPELGLRGRRRIVASGRVLLDGCPARPGTRVRMGQELVLRPASVPESASPALMVSTETDGLVAVVKPAGLHSAALAGGAGDSAEAHLAELFPSRVASGFPRLLNRLDRDTSGLLLVALDARGEQRWRAAGDVGCVEKSYRAVAQGVISKSLELNHRLDTKDCSRTRVLPETEADPLRRTLVRPLVHLKEEDVTVLEVTIFKGARHQIRVQLAAIGHPLLGDVLYGGPDAARLFLHHQRVRLPKFKAEVPPDSRRDAWPDRYGAGFLFCP